MPAKGETEEYIKKELPYQLLMKLYKNSRASLRELGKELDISYHVVHSVLENLEEEYDIRYTLEIDESKLGFAEGRIITIKFGTRPNLDFLKERLHKEIFVQAAYLAEGAFDLLLYVVGLTQSDFQDWFWNFRAELSEYKPILKFATVNNRSVGFLPLRNELVNETEELSGVEKRVLMLLNENSRIKLSILAKETKVSPNRIIYVIKKLRARGVIKRFSALVQNPDKKIVVAYAALLVPVKEHKKLLLAFTKELLKEDFHEAANDYSLILSVNGGWDTFDICAFQNGESAVKRGAELLQSLWAEEEPKIDKAILTDIIIGSWPFHLEKYDAYQKLLGSE